MNTVNVVDQAGRMGTATPLSIIGLTAPTAPTIPANMPTSFVVNGPSGSFDLSSYLKSGESIQIVSVANPGAGNQVGAPVVTVNGGAIDISVPSGYGISNI